MSYIFGPLDVRKNLMAAIVNNLRSTHKALALIDQKNQSGSNNTIIQAMAKNLAQMQDNLEKILDKPF